MRFPSEETFQPGGEFGTSWGRRSGRAFVSMIAGALALSLAVACGDDGDDNNSGGSGGSSGGSDGSGGSAGAASGGTGGTSSTGGASNTGGSSNSGGGSSGCGSTGETCDGSCADGYDCLQGFCVPAREMCGGIAGASCPDAAPVCVTCDGCDFGPCLTDEELECLCEAEGVADAFPLCAPKT